MQKLSGLQPVIEGKSENGLHHEPLNGAPLTNGNHEPEEPKTPKTPPEPRTPKTPPKENREPVKNPEETIQTGLNSARPNTRSGTASSRGRAGSSRPTTGYGKTRTGNEDQPPGKLSNKETNIWIYGHEKGPARPTTIGHIRPHKAT